MSESICFKGREYRILFPALMRPLTPEEDADLGEAIRREGRVIKDIVTDGNGGIIDGINRLRWAVKLDLPDTAILFRAVRGLSADQQRQLAIDLNDTGRQDPFAVRKANRQARVGRVAEARQAGESLRAIAEKEGVSESQVRRDIAEAESTAPSPGAVDSSETENSATQSNGTVSAAPAGGKVKGRDGRTRRAKPRKKKGPPKPCADCLRKGSPACDTCRENFPKGFPARQAGDDTDTEAEAERQDSADRRANGKPTFDDRKVTDAVGKLAKLLNERANALGQQKAAGWEKVREKMDALIVEWKAWQKGAA